MIINPVSNDPVRIGDQWVLPNGRTFPVISGGDDTAGEGGGTVTIETPVTPPEPKEGEQYFTAEQVEAIRKQEKDKLYPEVEKARQAAQAAKEEAEALSKQMEAFHTDVEAQKAAKQAEIDAAEADRIQREEAEMEAKELLTKKEAEWQARLEETETKWSTQFEQLQEDARQKDAMLEKERAFQALEAYKAQRIAEESDNLMPHLVDMIGGSTQEEIEAAISAVAAKTSAIMEDMQLGRQATAGPRAVPTTGASPTGPLENQTTQQTLTGEDIANMTMEQYAAHRPQLLAQARPQG